MSVLTFALASSSTLLAQGSSHKGRLTIDHPIEVAGQTLKAGRYQVRWEDDGATAQVKILRDAKVVVTTTAKVVALEKKPVGDRTDVVRDANGQESLTRLQFAGQMQELQFGDETAAK
jgi:capsular polysaccharide biosynthesis protein